MSEIKLSHDEIVQKMLNDSFFNGIATTMSYSVFMKDYLFVSYDCLGYIGDLSAYLFHHDSETDPWTDWIHDQCKDDYFDKYTVDLTDNIYFRVCFAAKSPSMYKETLFSPQFFKDIDDIIERWELNIKYEKIDNNIFFYGKIGEVFHTKWKFHMLLMYIRQNYTHASLDNSYDKDKKQLINEIAKLPIPNTEAFVLNDYESARLSHEYGPVYYAPLILELYQRHLKQCI